MSKLWYDIDAIEKTILYLWGKLMFAAWARRPQVHQHKWWTWALSQRSCREWVQRGKNQNFDCHWCAFKRLWCSTGKTLSLSMKYWCEISRSSLACHHQMLRITGAMVCQIWMQNKCMYVKKRASLGIIPSTLAWDILGIKWGTSYPLKGSRGKKGKKVWPLKEAILRSSIS